MNAVSLGRSAMDRDVGRDRAQAGRRDEGDRLFEQSTRRRTLELRVRVGEVAPKSPRLAARAGRHRARASRRRRRSGQPVPARPVSRRDPARVDASRRRSRDALEPMADSHRRCAIDEALARSPGAVISRCQLPGTTTTRRRGLQRARRRRWRRRRWRGRESTFASECWGVCTVTQFIAPRSR